MLNLVAAVTRLLEAGATIVGKAVCENLSLCASSFSAATGPVENPYAHGYACGGSSSGSGHLVGAGKVDGAIGGDQGGSIRFLQVIVVQSGRSQLGDWYLGLEWLRMNLCTILQGP